MLFFNLVCFDVLKVGGSIERGAAPTRRSLTVDGVQGQPVSYLQIHNHGLRLGAVGTAPGESLHVDVHKSNKEGNMLFNDALNTLYLVIWRQTTHIAREETCCRHIGYSFRLAARVLLYASSHRQDNTPVVEHWLEREIAQRVHHEGSIWRPIAPWVNVLTTELHLAPKSNLGARQQGYLCCRMLLRSNRYQNILLMMQCLITNIWSCLMLYTLDLDVEAILCFQPCFGGHFGNTSLFCNTTLVYETKDYAGSDISEEKLHRCNFISYYENSRQLDYIPVCTYNSRDGNSVVCASFSPSDHNFHDCLIQLPYLLVKSCRWALQHLKLEHPFIRMVI